MKGNKGFDHCLCDLQSSTSDRLGTLKAWQLLLRRCTTSPFPAKTIPRRLLLEASGGWEISKDLVMPTLVETNMFHHKSNLDMFVVCSRKSLCVRSFWVFFRGVFLFEKIDSRSSLLFFIATMESVGLHPQRLSCVWLADSTKRRYCVLWRCAMPWVLKMISPSCQKECPARMWSAVLFWWSWLFFITWFFFGVKLNSCTLMLPVENIMALGWNFTFGCLPNWKRSGNEKTDPFINSCTLIWQEDLAPECWLVPAAVIEMVCGSLRWRFIQTLWASKRIEKSYPPCN